MSPTALRRPAGILFDFGDTLMEEGRLDLRAAAERVLSVSRDRNGCTTDTLVDALSDVLSDLDVRRKASQLEPSPDAMFRLVYEPLGIRFDLSIAEVEWEFWSAGIRWTLEPGVTEAARAVAAAGIPCGVVSNAMFRGSTIARQLALSGLDGFRFVMASSDVIYRKPNPRIFLVAAQRLGVKCEGLWFVGDSLENDIAGAAAVGMLPVWYRRRHSASVESNYPGLTVSGWPEFVQLLGGINEPGARIRDGQTRAI